MLSAVREPCLEMCSVWRITRCKQGINLELARMGLLGGARARLYWLLDFVKGSLDFFRWSRLVNGVTESIDGFIAVSKALWDIHVHHLPSLSSKPFSVVYNPVTEPLKHVKPDPHEPYGDYALYASGLTLLKDRTSSWRRGRRSPRSSKTLSSTWLDARTRGLREKARQMNLRNIGFMERLPPNRQHYYLVYKAKAIVMPSLVPEAFGRIPVEVNRLGVPAIVTNRGALPEIIEDGITDTVTKADSSSLAEAITKTLSRNWDRGIIIGRVSERINPSNIINRLLGFFEKIVV